MRSESEGLRKEHVQISIRDPDLRETREVKLHVVTAKGEIQDPKEDCLDACVNHFLAVVRTSGDRGRVDVIHFATLLVDRSRRRCNLLLARKLIQSLLELWPANKARAKAEGVTPRVDHVPALRDDGLESERTELRNVYALPRIELFLDERAETVPDQLHLPVRVQRRQTLRRPRVRRVVHPRVELGVLQDEVDHLANLHSCHRQETSPGTRSEQP